MPNFRVQMRIRSLGQRMRGVVGEGKIYKTQFQISVRVIYLDNHCSLWKSQSNLMPGHGLMKKNVVCNPWGSLVEVMRLIRERDCERWGI